MSKKAFQYTFQTIHHCNMCGSEVSTHKRLGRRLNTNQGRKPSKKSGITTTIYQCSNCRLIYANPQPIPLDIQDHYGVPPESYWTQEAYFKVDESYFQREITKLKSLMNIESGMKSLDIGAGLGKQMIALEKAGFETYGFEPSEPFYERAISKMGINPERLKIGSIENVDYPENEFDFISFGAVLEHLYDPGGSIEKAMKWLKPGGIIHIEVPSSDWMMSKLINAYYRLALTDYVVNISPMHEPYHLYEFSIKTFEAHAKLHNYKIVAHDTFVGQSFMPKPLDAIVRPIMEKTNTGMQIVIWLGKK